jgi:hypothetical protein
LRRRFPAVGGLARVVKVVHAAEKTNLPTVAAITLPNQVAWIASGTVRSGNTIHNAFSGSTPTSHDISAVTGVINALPNGLDIALSAIDAAHKAHRIAVSKKTAAQGGGNALLTNDAQRMLAHHKAELIQAAPGALRDTVLGSVALHTRVFADLHPGEFVFGTLNSTYQAASGVAMSSGTAFVAAGALLARSVARAVDRNLALGGALRNPPSRRTDTVGSAARELDEKFSEDADALISPNVYSILRTRGNGYMAEFKKRLESLDPDARKQLKKLLHFRGEQITFNALNFGRTTNLNTASHRREVREKVMDAFVAYDLESNSAASLFSHLDRVRKEARGARSAPQRADILKFLEHHGIDQAEFGWNTLNALSTSGVEKDFLARYDRLDKKERARLRSALHFDGWRFWKSNGTLTTTKARRADIRQSIIKRFASGCTLEDIERLQWKYSADFTPLQEQPSRRWSLSPSGLLRQNMDAVLHADLDTLKGEQQHAKVQMLYGAINIAASVGELAVNPLAPQLTATHTVLSPLYLIYAARRGLAKQIRERNARAIDLHLREESLLATLPQEMRNLATAEAAALKHLSEPQQFLKNELQLSDAETKKLLALAKSGNSAAAHEMLVTKAPENSLLVALRVMAESLSNRNFADYSIKKSSITLLVRERVGGTASALERMLIGANPEEIYKALKEHFLDNGAYQPSARLDRLFGSARRTGAGRTAHRDSHAAKAADALKEKVRLARDNPHFAIRLFVEALFSHGQSAADARNMLRDCRFTETEISDLCAMGMKDASIWLKDHLFGQNVRQRFAPITLDQRGRDQASMAVEVVNLGARSATRTEPLTWRRGFEDRGMRIIENPGTPGLDSMLFALHHSFVGKDNLGSSEVNKKIARARIAVLKKIKTAEVDIDKHWDTIVAVAGRYFGKEKPTVKLARTRGGLSTICGPKKDDLSTPLAAVLCYDDQTHRMFVVHGGGTPARRTTNAQPPRPARFSMTQRMSVLANRFSLPMIDTSDPGFHEVFAVLDSGLHS